MISENTNTVYATVATKGQALKRKMMTWSQDYLEIEKYMREDKKESRRTQKKSVRTTEGNHLCPCASYNVGLRG
jgi:t-SNARE complex subunit (syntaxin)